MLLIEPWRTPRLPKAGMSCHWDARGVPLTHSPAPLQQYLERPRLCLLAQKVGCRLQEADAVDHEDLGGDHDLTLLGQGQPRTGGKPFGPGAANRHRLLVRRGATVEKPNLVEKEERAREETQHQGAQGDFAHPWATTMNEGSAGVVGRPWLGDKEWWGYRVGTCMFSMRGAW